MKHILSLLCTLLLLCSAASAAFDYTPYELQGYYPLDVTLLDDGTVAASAWEYEDGSGERFFTWWKDGTIIRAHLLPHELYGFNPMKRDDGSLALLYTSFNEATRDSKTPLYTCQLCTVDEQGFGQLTDISNAAISLHRECSGAFALFELRDSQAWLNLYEGTPEWSWSIPMNVDQPMSLYLARVSKNGERWLIEYNPSGIRQTEGYRLMCIEQGVVLWDRELSSACGIHLDGDGGYYLIYTTGSGNYKPLQLLHYAADGAERTHKTISSSKLVLGAMLWQDPTTGLLHLYGTAVANSRKVYPVWHLVCDADLNPVTDMDVRDCTYYGDYSPILNIAADGACHVLLHGISQTSVQPVLVPFDALPCISNPDLSIK